MKKQDFATGGTGNDGMLARFIGCDCSMGLRKGRLYYISICTGYWEGRECFWVDWTFGHCPYYSREGLQKNWRLVNGLL